MAKTATAKKNKAAATAPNKASAKMTGEDIINIDTPLRKKQRRYTVNQYSKGSKNCIDMDFPQRRRASQKCPACDVP
jgi:hypothetical protein